MKHAFGVLLLLLSLNVCATDYVARNRAGGLILFLMDTPCPVKSIQAPNVFFIATTNKQHEVVLRGCGVKEKNGVILMFWEDGDTDKTHIRELTALSERKKSPKLSI